MSIYTEYYNFLRVNGRPLVDINPGSDEVALSVSDTLHAMQLLIDQHIPIIGGDILTETKHGTLAYALHEWGQEYHTLNWSFRSRDVDENLWEYCKESHAFAHDKIIAANNSAERLGMKCYIVLII